jgi:uncharacterized protein YndB with AHSA1/START domain
MFTSSRARGVVHERVTGWPGLGLRGPPVAVPLAPAFGNDFSGETGLEHEVTQVTVDVTTETLIERDRQTVTQYASDPSNAPTWYANIDSVEWETEPPIVVGSRMAFVARFLGRRLVYTYEVTDLAPNERLVMRTSQGPFPMETTYTWATTPSGATRMTLRNRGEPAGFSRLAGPFIASAMRRANRKDLARLKSLLEER